MNRVNMFAAVSLTLALGTHAQTSTTEHSAHHASGVATSEPAAKAMAEGEVRRIDPEQKKVTLRHGPIANLDMPPMTMVFLVADGTLLASFKEGDKVRFAAERINGAISVTAIEAVPK